VEANFSSSLVSAAFMSIAVNIGVETIREIALRIVITPPVFSRRHPWIKLNATSS
jgi:hypothetical protein